MTTMSTRMLAALSMALLAGVAGCGPGTGDGGNDRSGAVSDLGGWAGTDLPGDTLPQDVPPVPVTVTLAVPPDLQAAGVVVHATVISPDSPALERSRTSRPGEEDLVVEARAGDYVIASVVDGEGQVVRIQAMAADFPEWSVPGESCRTLVVPTPAHPTIQAAVDAAKACDTVLVLPGTYREFVTLHAPIRLLGSGPLLTVLDGSQPVAGRRALVDYTDGPGSLIAGFRFTGVPPVDVGCADPSDPFLCSGDWYVAAVYGDGHSAESALRASVFLVHNVFDGNEIAVMSYFHALAVVRNNVFVGNRYAFVGNHFQDQSLIANNVFYRNEGFAIGSSAAYLDVVNNLFVENGEAMRHEYVQTGWIRCNLFWANGEVGQRVPLGSDGNLELDPGFLDPASGNFLLGPSSPALDMGCFAEQSPDLDGSPQDMGAFGGSFGRWADGE